MFYVSQFKPAVNLTSGTSYDSVFKSLPDSQVSIKWKTSWMFMFTVVVAFFPPNT